MAAGRIPGPIGSASLAHARFQEGARFATPGPTQGALHETFAASEPQQRTLSAADLMRAARTVMLRPRHGKSVFYHGGQGAAAEAFVRQNPSYTRIDDLLAETSEGGALLRALEGRRWSDAQDVWWELSRRLAAESSGDVHVFGTGRYGPGDGGSVDNEAAVRSHWQSRHPSARAKFADDIFEKIELPVLETNPNIGTIYYNGRDIDQS